MKILKLFLGDFDPNKGRVSYVVEDEKGDRVAMSEHTSESLKNYNPSTMDFFVLAFLPQARRMGAKLSVQGPVSRNLKHILGDSISVGFLVDGDGLTYKDEDINFFTYVFEERRNLNKTLASVFNYFKEA